MLPTTVSQIFSRALRCHQEGRLGEAEALYRQVVAAQPGHAEAWHRLGLLAYEHGRYALAVELIRRAVAIDPGACAAHSNLGEAFRAAGQLDEAHASFRHALEINPCYAFAHYNLANVLLQRGQPAEAIASYRRALQFQPGLAEAWNNLGTALRQEQRPDEAFEAWSRAVELRPDYAEALTNFGTELGYRKDFERALDALRKAVQIRPGYAPAHLNLGDLYWKMGRQEAAVDAWRRTLALQPDFAEAHYNLGNAFKEQGQFQEALGEYERAIVLKPGFAGALNNLGQALMELGRFDEAASACRQALEIDPRHAPTQYNLSVLALRRGEYAAAWVLFESRLEILRHDPRHFAQPRWDGRALSGQRVLLCSEQGFGDSIQCIRYAPLIAERGGKVIVECRRPLAGLLRSVEGVRAVMADGEAPPPFDIYLPIMSLPLVFQATLETIPREVPYLFVDPARRQIWRDRLGEDRSRLRVGLAWAGNPLNVQLRKRDIPLEQLAPLLAVNGVEFHSLQMDQASRQLRQCSRASAVIDHTPEIHDFSDTAALMMELDLIITVDTAIAHLAGALGRPVWTLLSWVADWRWGSGGEAAPWYPTMRLFRQPALGDWDTVVVQVTAELSKTVRNEPGR